MKNKILTIATIFLIFCLFISNIVIAADNICKLSLNASENQIKPGDIVEVILKVSDINAENGIAAVSGIIEYDTDVFEKIEYEAGNNWATPTIIENSILINTSNLESTKANQDILKIKLTTKSSVKDGAYSITLKSIDVSTDDDSFTIDDISTKVNIKSESTNTDNDTNENQNQNQSSTQETNTTGNQTENEDKSESKPENKVESTIDNKDAGKSNVLTSNKENNTINANVSSSNLPKTGITNHIIIFIVGALIIATVSYFKYKKYNSMK